MIIPVIFIAVGVVNIKKVNKRLDQIQELNLRGKLVKNLPYHLENSNITVNNVPINPIFFMKISVAFRIESILFP